MKDNRDNITAIVNSYLLQVLKVHLNGKGKVEWTENITLEEWNMLFEKAFRHHVLPIVYEVVYSCESFKRYEQQLISLYKRQVLQNVFLQTSKTVEFLQLYQYLEENGISPLVVKGIICRELYPVPDYRLSGDEDIIVNAGEYNKFHKLMTDFGMQPVNKETDINRAEEISYSKSGSNLYIEVHKKLFPSDSEAYGEFNEIFKGFQERKVVSEVQGIPISTMGYSDHMLYLITHAFKHFMHSGFGIRQVCDIMMYAVAYGAEIDWEWILNKCEKIHADVFVTALFEIGYQYLGFDKEQMYLSEGWGKIHIDPLNLLEDMLSGGIYGAVDNERIHSSNITLNAVVSDKKKPNKKKNILFMILKTIFPSRKVLIESYKYLEKYPFLLPVAWISRIFKYSVELKDNNSAMESIKIGNKRVELMREYKIIK